MNIGKKVTRLIFAIICMTFVSCSDNSSSVDESDMNADSGEGTFNVSGDLEAQHQGISQFVGLKASNGDFLNLTLNVTEHPLGSQEINDFSFSIRMVGDGGPFTLEIGEYEIGQDSEGVILIVNYANRMISDETVTYGTSPNSSGTVSILSVSPTSIEATFDVMLDVDVTADEGSVNITGELIAECFTAAPGTGC
jgi:hypothetical protein